MNKSEARIIAVVFASELSILTRQKAPIFESIEASMGQENAPHIVITRSRRHGHIVKCFYDCLMMSCFEVSDVAYKLRLLVSKVETIREQARDAA